MKIKKKNLRCTTHRLEVRLFKKSDFKVWRTACSNRQQKQNEYDKGPPPKESLTKGFLNNWIEVSKKAREKDLVYTFGLFHKKTGEYIGLVNFAVISRFSYQFANLGYEINNQYWGQGFAGEGIQAAAHLAFSQLKLHRIEAGIQPENKASIRVCEKLDMHSEGTRKKFYYDGKTWHDLVYFSLTAEDFGINNQKPIIRYSLKEAL